MTKRVFHSLDDGAIYKPEDIDDAEGYVEYDIEVPVTLSYDEIVQGEASLLEILVRAGKATKV